MFIKRLLNRQSIQQKLVYANIISIALVVTVTTLLMLCYQYVAIKDAVLQEIRTQTDIIRDSSAAAVAFNDAKAAEEALLALKSAPDILEAHLLSIDGTLLAHYHKEAKEEENVSAFTIDLEHTQEKLTFSCITIRKPIFLRSNPVGTVYLKGSLHSFYSRLGWYLFFTILAAFIASLMANKLSTHISRSITEPLAHLLSATKRITAENDYSTELSVDAKDEVGALTNAFGEMMSEIKKRDLSLQQLAYYDRVTGLPNRHYFEERITQAVNNAERYGSCCYLMLIDLDDFKIVNDTLGHAMGDKLLLNVGKILKHTLRNNDSIFRIGGDEFAVILENVEKDSSAKNVAKKIIQAVSTPVMLEGSHVHIQVGASIGISQYPLYADSKSTLISTADSAMYVAKARGKNDFEVFKKLK